LPGPELRLISGADFAGARRSWRARFLGALLPFCIFSVRILLPLDFSRPTYSRLVFPGYFYVFQIFPGRVILPAKISEKFNFRQYFPVSSQKSAVYANHTV
jgi:hypothetical protein